jgi:eukaryotic-like serine/threonine-protein kinase
VYYTAVDSPAIIRSVLKVMATKTRIQLPRSPFFDAIRKSGLLTPDDLIAVVAEYDITTEKAADPIATATFFVKKKLLTKYQAMQLLQGRTGGFLLGQYKILNGLRQDRVGMVFLAEDTRNGQRVSVKVLPTDRTNDPTILSAFRKEVQLAAQVDHSNVARVLDYGIHQGTHFVVSEYVPGPSLDVVTSKGPPNPDEIARHVARVAVVLKYAHARGLFHRDIKPANIGTTDDGRVKLIDLGLTHMLENPWARVTVRIKTKEYAEEIDHVAPEQAWGCEPDERADIYSLGSTFYRLLTKQSPFPGDAAEKMKARQLAPIPAPSEVNTMVSAELDRIVQKMGHNQPHERYQSMDLLLIDLHPWLPITEWLGLGIAAPAPKMANRDGAKATSGGGLLNSFKRFFGR